MPTLDIIQLFKVNTDKKLNSKAIKISTHETHNTDLHEEFNRITNLEKDTDHLHNHYQNENEDYSAYHAQTLATVLIIIIIIVPIIIWTKIQINKRKSV